MHGGMYSECVCVALGYLNDKANSGDVYSEKTLDAPPLHHPHYSAVPQENKDVFI